MPGFIKTPEDERLWAKAKARAKAEGKGENYAYITGIYKAMNGGKTGAERVAAMWMLKNASEDSALMAVIKPHLTAFTDAISPGIQKILNERVQARMDELLGDQLAKPGTSPKKKEEFREYWIKENQPDILREEIQNILTWFENEPGFEIDLKLKGKPGWNINLGFQGA